MSLAFYRKRYPFALPWPAETKISYPDGWIVFS